MNTSVNFTFDKIKYLEKNRGVSFSDGLERYFKLSGEKKEEFAVYYLLFNELRNKTKAKKDAITA